MAVGIYHIAGVRLPHPPIPIHLLLVVEQALAEAWKRLKRNPPPGFDITSATEDVVTFHLHEVLVNDIYRRRRVPGFVREIFNPPQREPKISTFNRASIDKMPDLRIDLVDRPNVTLEFDPRYVVKVDLQMDPEELTEVVSSFTTDPKPGAAEALR